jgi:hypothetical protein
MWEMVPKNYTAPLEEWWKLTAPIKCEACKAGSWSVRETVGNIVFRNALTEIVIGACYYVIEGFGFRKDVCPGIIK